MYFPFATRRVRRDAVPIMISAIEPQPAGSSLDLVRQVEEIFSPTGILSRAKNFEYRPEQQQMEIGRAHV